MKARLWQTCNVFSAKADDWRLWRFQRAKSGPVLEREVRGEDGKPVPSALGARSIRHLWQPLLNVAWLPPEQVFLRVMDLPAGDPAEAPLMVEFELERLSPLPVADILWTCEVLPAVPGERLTVLVIMAAREAVEACATQAEECGCLPDRIELPQVRELLTQPPTEDSAWILLRRIGEDVSCLAAWWSGGRLRHVELERISAEEASEAPIRLGRRLCEAAWAGELAGWCGPHTRWQLVTDEGLAAQFQGQLAEVLPGLSTRPPRAWSDLAADTARAGTRANLLPEETRQRNRQQFIDRIWMRSLSTIALIYIFGVLGYFAFLNIQSYRKDSVDLHVALMHQSYTNTLALKAKVEVLRNQIDLKFAALDCLKAVADTLPSELELTSFSFQRGQRLNLFGTVPADAQAQVTAFTEALANADREGREVFSKVSTKAIQARPNRPASWTIECEIAKPESR